jgi:ring-1,2-phenylacetyl-CoA epoxidase subunit PaaD
MSASPQPRSAQERAWELLAGVPDPEIPVLSIVDLGIVREVRRESDGRLRVRITPTYSGCPATDLIRGLVREALDDGGFADALLEEVLSPPWSSAWVTAAGREKLRAFGIAPPEEGALGRRRDAAAAVTCPRCSIRDTARVSEFG